MNGTCDSKSRHGYVFDVPNHQCHFAVIFLAPVIKPDTLQPYWLSWNEGRLAMGRGELVGNYQFISYLDEDTPLSVSYLAFSTTKGATGLWQFYNITGKIRACKGRHYMLNA